MKIIQESPVLYMQEPRKKPRSSFKALHQGVCSKCNELIEIGQTARFGANGQIHHARHKSTPRSIQTCPKCWLVLPCDCEEV
jgi:hypothetical protein